MPSNTARRIPAAQRQRFEHCIHASDVREAGELAESFSRRYPQDPFSWQAQSKVLHQQKDYEGALSAGEQAVALSGEGEVDRALSLLTLSRAQFALEQLPEAERSLTEAAEQSPDNADVYLMLGHVYFAQRREEEAIDALDQALALNPTSIALLALRIHVFSRARRFATVMRDCDALMALKPRGATFYNLVGTKYQDIGQFEQARAYYREALRRDPQELGAASNIFTGMHYDPKVSAREIYDMALSWRHRFPVTPQPPSPRKTHPAQRLRIGLLSAGFQSHPVGYMILPGLVNTKRPNLEYYVYSLDPKEDFVTQQLKRISSTWKMVEKKGLDELDRILREDQLDILIDMSGHNEGSRLTVLARKPAPLIVKWVGGLINTTGLEAFDYLLSDTIETPPGIDDWYVEKLIRLPDDYICYSTPPYVPSTTLPKVKSLPALSNGYLTLGCLNNPTKINPELLGQWARLMQVLPGSHLLLKGGQYEDEGFCQGIRDCLAGHGIAPERVELDGPSKHKEFMRTYWRIDIALDPWPYSGGLTTCEAMMMGVPVVTHPGPTFAGRHAATHVTNAGFPEWVCDSWETYQERVLELANDLDGLASLRHQLRERVLASPLCDGKRFAENLDGALRAIWQRYCEGKSPAALTFTGQGECQFEDEDAPVELQHPRSYLTPRIQAERRFNWQLPGKLVVIDNSAKLLGEEGIDALLKLDAFGIVAFDPSSQLEKPERFAERADVQLLPHAVLGDGQPATLHACLDPAMSSILEPLPAEQLPVFQRQGAQVLAKLPISTVALNGIAGLESLDWLILDHLSDANTILEHGDQALKDSLLIQVRVAFQPTHQRQPNLAELQRWMTRHGFRFYRFNDLSYESHLPPRDDLINPQSSELTGADVLFLPSVERMARLSDAQRIKLAFLLHTVFNVKDLTYELLTQVDEDRAEDYLLAQGMVRAIDEQETEETEETETLTDATDTSAQAEDDSIAPPTSLLLREPIDDEIIFVIGCGHTGTTLMACMLGAHPEIYTIQRETFWFVNNPAFEAEYPVERQQCLLEGKKRVCEKTPCHVYKILEIKKLFPNAKFVAMVRDSKDVIASMQKRVPELHDKFESAIKRYINENGALLRQLPNDDITVVRYEDLVIKSEATMRRVSRFLGLAYSPKMLTFYEKGYHWEGIKNPEKTDGKDGKGHLDLRAWQMLQPIQDNRGIWKGKLSKGQVKVVNENCGQIEKKLNAFALREAKRLEDESGNVKPKNTGDDKEEFIFD